MGAPVAIRGVPNMGYNWLHTELGCVLIRGLVNLCQVWLITAIGQIGRLCASELLPAGRRRIVGKIIEPLNHLLDIHSTSLPKGLPGPSERRRGNDTRLSASPLVAITSALSRRTRRCDRFETLLVLRTNPIKSQGWKPRRPRYLCDHSHMRFARRLDLRQNAPG